MHASDLQYVLDSTTAFSVHDAEACRSDEPQQILGLWMALGVFWCMSLLFSMCNFIATGLLQQSVCMLAGCLADRKVKLSSQHVSWSCHKKFGMLFV